MILKRLAQIVISATLALPLVAQQLPEDLMAVVKFPPPKTFTQKVMSVARVVQPGQQTEMLPLFMLGAFGYPNYPGVSETDSVSVFLFGSDEPSQMPFVILAKVAEDSPLRQTITSFNWALEERNGWVLIAKDAASLAYIDDMAPYLALNAEPANFDVEVRFFLGKDKVTAWSEDFKEILLNEVAQGEPMSDEETAKTTRYVDFAAKTAENLNWAELGIDLSAETVTIGSLFDAQAGTPEGDLFSASYGGEVPVAKFVEATGMMQYMMHIDVEAFSTYYDVWQARAMALAGEGGQAWLESMGKVMQGYFTLSDGTSAGTLSMVNEEAQVKSVMGGEYTNEIVVAYTRDVAENLLPQLFVSVPLFGTEGMDYSFTFEENVAEVSGIPVQVFKSVVSIEPPELESGQQIPQDILDEFTQEQESYYAVVEGSLLNTTTLDGMKALVPAVKAGESVSGNVGESLSLKSGQALAYQVDLTKYFSMTINALPDTDGSMDQIKEVLAQLESTQMAPASGLVSVGDNRVKSTFSLPVSSLAQIVQGFQAVQMSQPQDDPYSMPMGAPAPGQ